MISVQNDRPASSEEVRELRNMVAQLSLVIGKAGVTPSKSEAKKPASLSKVSQEIVVSLTQKNDKYGYVRYDSPKIVGKNLVACKVAKFSGGGHRKHGIVFNFTSNKTLVKNALFRYENNKKLAKR